MTPHAPVRASLPVLLAAALLTFVAVPACAQSLRVTTGEHDGFTRVVLQAREGFDWSLSPEGRVRRIALPAASVQLDQVAVFRIIPRTRLADLRRMPGGIELMLNCDCPIVTDEPRSGVVVFDIHDPAPTPVAAPRRPGPDRAERLPVTPIARAVGNDLARRMRSEAEASRAEDVVAEPTLERDALSQQLTGQIAQAISQGMLAADPTRPDAEFPRPAGETAGHDLSNLRITLAADPNRSAPEFGEPANACPPAALLTFPTNDGAPPFVERQAALMRQLFGEFDLADAEGHTALARLYLEHGLGAEARLVIENAPAQLPGRDLLLGLSDVFEDRFSNARMRLADRGDCGGNAALFAALAGGDPDLVASQSMTIARDFAELPEPMRRALGEMLVRRLLDAEARDAARMVASSLRHLSDPSHPGMTLIDALLDAARGDLDAAAARLDHGNQRDGAALLTRLQIALDRGEDADARLLADAEAVAASERTTDTGRTIMALLIRLQNAAEAPLAAFSLLDRLENWLPATTQNTADLAELRDLTWATLGATAEDRTFLETVFDRNDWRAQTLTEPTRLALAERLLDFGLPDPAAALLGDNHNAPARPLQARLALLTGDPTGALDSLSGVPGEAADRLRAQAQRALHAMEAAATATQSAASETEATAEAPDIPPAPADVGLMLRSTTLLSESAQLRDALDGLLSPAP